MTKEILELISNTSVWGGNVYNLAAILIEKQKEIDAAMVEELYPEASALIRGQ